MRGGRLYWRRIRQRERATPPPRPAEYRGELDYDRNDIMDKIDSLPPGWRMLINEYGFTPVMKAREFVKDINAAERLMRQRHNQRQRDLAEGRF